MEIRIATAPCSWGVFYADGGTSGVPCETFLRQAAEAGYSEIELGPEGYLPEDGALLREALERSHLTVCAGTATIPFGILSADACRDWVTPLAERLAALEVRDMVVMDGTAYEDGLEKKTAWSEAVWSRVYQGISAINTYLRDGFGIRMVFHPHAGTAIEYTAEIEKMLEMGEISLCFDTGHHVYCNGGTDGPDQSALDFLKAHRDRIPYLHFKNVDGVVRRKAAREHWTVGKAFENQVMCNLADGIIDFCQLRDTLEEIGYRGTAVIEQDMFNQPAEYAYHAAKANLQYLEQIHMIP